MESNKTSSKPSDLDSDEIHNSESISDPQKNSQVLSAKKKKRRLATTRGLVTSAKGSSLRLVTPTNSPSTFRPNFGSTPVTENSEVSTGRNSNKLVGISSLQLPPHLRLRGSQFPTVPQPSSSNLRLPTPITSIPVSVISSTRLEIDRELASASLDWDNYEDSPSYGLYHKPLLSESLQVNDCLSEIQSLSTSSHMLGQSGRVR